MQQRPPPRWPPPVPQTRWMQPPARPAFVPPFPPPVRGIPRFYPPPPRPPRGFFPRFVPPRPPPPPRPPVVDAEQTWLDTFKRTHCNSTGTSKIIADSCDEPPLRLLRRRVARAQKLAGQLTAAATELAAVEKRLESLSGDSEDNRRASEDAALSVEVSRLRVQRERKLAVCESLKTELEAMDAASGLFPEQQLAEIRGFAARVNRKKAYRKRVKQQRRAEASIRRAVGSSESTNAARSNDCRPTSDTALRCSEAKQEPAIPSLQHKKADSGEQQPETYLSAAPSTPKPSLDPETLTIDKLIAVRRAWDSYIVYPQTPGASTIPPHFVPPPPAPSPQWAIYATPCASAGAAS
ncbi:hypothetical protein PR003_g847 [Phytophthora rubi]|uniref:Uncharacterized protein n=1 Tax=Phytophthora rubi TaxID=129364 RepID=A0A6A3PI74_9STRA|nr:hypothetical protein PR001_g676 [Phytophthora rubi]KAE9359260.1 hypothetical protein PR003_g847 [Phytophthora rubi]